jgi:hypothetical protein
MEYLMTYGWAILVVMIVGVVLWQLNIFGGNSSANAVGFKLLKPLNPGQLEMSEADGFSGVFMNGAGGTVTLTDVVTVFTAPSGVDCTGADPLTEVELPGSAAPIVLGGGGCAAGECRAVGQGDTFSLSVPACTGQPTEGGRYSATMTISYTIDVGGFEETRTEVGTVSGPVIA